MRDNNYFAVNFSLSVFTTVIYLFLINALNGIWFSVHLTLGVAYLIIIMIGLYGMSLKRTWAPIPFLLLFGAQAIDGFYIFAMYRHWTIMIFIIIAIFALYRSVGEAELYKIMKKQKKLKRIQKQKEAEMKRKEAKKKLTKKTKKKTTKKASPKTKKTSKKTTKKTA